jgi:formate/nitrite transporter FocA (FNT family)
MAYIEPSKFVTKMVDSGESKLFMSTKDTLVRAFMAGAILGLAAFFAISVITYIGNLLVGSLFSPSGLSCFT